MVVAGLDSSNQRIEESVKLMQWGFNAWQVKPLYKQGVTVGNAKVQLGSDDEVALVTPHPYSLTMPAGILSKVVSTKIRYKGPLKAPIKKGDHVADLVVKTSDMGEQVMPLVAGEDVGEAGFFNRAWIGFKQLLGMA